MARNLTPMPTVDTTMAELLAGWPAARSVVGRRGMACVGCAMARFETVAEAAEAYGFDADRFIHEVGRANICRRPTGRAHARGKSAVK